MNNNELTLTILSDGDVEIANESYHGSYSHEEFAQAFLIYNPTTVKELWDRLEDNC